MKMRPVASNEEAKNLRGLPCLAIDLGFAAKRASCGLSTHDDGLTFDGALKATAAWIQNNESQEKVLILEAPLSGSFDQNGNPSTRGKFETHHSETNESNERRWHAGGGASMALAAIHFLHHLRKAVPGTGTTIHLIEGFCSRYGESKPSDTSVAKELHRRWLSDQALIEPAGATRLSALRMLESDALEAPPAILAIPDGFSGNAITP